MTVTSTALMNRIYRRQRHIYDATRKYFLLGRDLLIARLAPEGAACVLEIGCGTGRNLILAAQRYPDARFFGIDVSTEMLTSAIEAIARAGLSSRIHVAHADATAFDPGRLFDKAQFDRVFISYSLSMIPDWRGARQRDRAVVPGGELHIVDFGGQRACRAGSQRCGAGWRCFTSHRATTSSRHSQAPIVLARRSSSSVPYRDYAQYARSACRRSDPYCDCAALPPPCGPQGGGA